MIRGTTESFMAARRRQQAQREARQARATDEEHAMPWRWAEPEHMLLEVEGACVLPVAAERGGARARAGRASLPSRR